MEIVKGINNLGQRVAYFDTDINFEISKSDLVAKLVHFRDSLIQQQQTGTGPKGGASAATDVYLGRIKYWLDELSTVIPHFSSHESDKFLMPSKVIEKINHLEEERNYVDAIAIFYERIIFKGLLEETLYRIELSLSDGAHPVKVVTRMPAYINAYATTKFIYCYEAVDEKAEAEKAAVEINNTCRIFRCATCGKITTTPKANDEYNLSQGIPIMNVCSICNGMATEQAKTAFFSSEESSKVRIFEVNKDMIIFEDGSKITYDHEQDCCEDNYADFEQLDDIARNAVFDTKHMIFEAVPESGFRFGNPGNMFFIPCYSEQSGYYTDEIDVYYNEEKVLNLKCNYVNTSE